MTTTERPKEGGVKGLMAGRSDLYRFRFEDLEIGEGWNVRQPSPELQAHIEWLSGDIAEYGVKEPLRGYFNHETNKVRLTNGHCRHDAIKLGIERGNIPKDTEIPLTLEDKKSNEVERIATMLRSNSGKPLTPLEMANVARRLSNHHWTPEKIGKTCNPPVSVATVNHWLTLSSATPETEQMVRNGAVSATTVVNEIRATDPETAQETIKTAVRVAAEQGVKASGDAVKAVREQIARQPKSENSDPAPLTVPKRISKAEYEAAIELRDLLRDLWPNAVEEYDRDADTVTKTFSVPDAKKLEDLL